MRVRCPYTMVIDIKHACANKMDIRQETERQHGSRLTTRVERRVWHDTWWIGTFSWRWEEEGCKNRIVAIPDETSERTGK